MRGWIVIATLTLAGCLDPRTTTCGDLVCPVGKVCAPNNSGCVFPEQLTVCDGAADGAECGYPEVPMGICRGGICSEPYCGDAVTSGAEMCDDGNAEAGDGCSSDCLSNEACGNAVTDLSVQEECDDGNLRSHDGCSSGCLIELVSWVEHEAPGTPMFWHQLVYDAARGRIVAIEGTTPSLQRIASVAVHEGQTLARYASGMRPREQHVSVYDARRRVTVTFGGAGDAGVLDDTWEHDGTTSVEISPATSPPARRLAAAAYDGARGTTVIFGGLDASDTALADTWVYDGTTWTNPTPATSPPARASHVMGYDSVRQRVVLFGGEGLQDTWEWDGTAWTETTPATLPNARGAMAFDANRARMVLFGGDRDPRGIPSDHTWEYDGATWVETTPTVSPPARVSPAMAYDAVKQRIVLISGGVGNVGAGYEDVWEYDGATWTNIELRETPTRRIAHGMTYDAWRGATYVFGGFLPGVSPNNDTWRFDGRQWTEIETENTPPAPNPMGPPPYWPSFMVFDPNGGRSLFVENSMGGQRAWALTGSLWSVVSTGAAPPNRNFGAVAYDSARDRLVVFGGENGPTSRRDDTWELGGGTWTEMTPTASPSPRSDPAVTYDAGRGQVVIFGGRDNSGTLDDTWAYDGAAWVEIDSTLRPSKRSGAALVYDPARQALVLFMGEDGVTPKNDLWELRDGQWRELVLLNPPPRKSARLVYDSIARNIVLYGGDPEEDHWSLVYSSATPDETCNGGADDDGDALIDCADPDCDQVSCGPPSTNLRCDAGACSCRLIAEMHCGDDFDDDCDGMVDCDDADCSTTARCSAESNCDDTLDDDGDGLTDCADPGCQGSGFCTTYEVACGDSEDNDGDGAVDCADADCYLVACAAVTP